jgi:hypothetical protein
LDDWLATVDSVDRQAVMTAGANGEMMEVSDALTFHPIST